MSNDKDGVLVQHILDAIAAVHIFIRGLKIADFIENDLVGSAVIKKFEVIGEASNKLSVDFKNQHKTIPWSQIIGMRNILIHDYIGADLEGVWNTIHQDLPLLKEELEKIKKPALSSLRGIAKEKYQEFGGGKKHLEEERNSWNDS